MYNNEIDPFMSPNRSKLLTDEETGSANYVITKKYLFKNEIT